MSCVTHLFICVGVENLHQAAWSAATVSFRVRFPALNAKTSNEYLDTRLPIINGMCLFVFRADWSIIFKLGQINSFCLQV